MKKFRFMVLEDDEIFMELNEKIIERSGFAEEAIYFNQAQKGLDYIIKYDAENKPLPDIILLDLWMPLLNGFEFLEKLKSISQVRLKELHIHILTSSLDDTDILKAYSYSWVKGFHSKPLSQKIMEEIVKIRT